MRDDIARAQDVLDAISLIEKTLSTDLKVYDLSEIEFQGILRCLEIIGEACKSITTETKDKFPHIPWRAISDMRNVLAHQYFEVDQEKIEMVVHNSLDELKKATKEILSE